MHRMNNGYTCSVGNETIRIGKPPAAAADTPVLGGRYRLLDALGHGGMGVVYRALDLELGEMIAVKFLDTTTPTPDRVERLREEARLARKVTHRNVARIYDIGEDANRWYLTMQLVEGASLRQVLDERKRLPCAEAVGIAAEICEGLAVAHTAGVIHLDLKPENVMLPQGGGVVVLDFGVARLASDDRQPGNVVGTPGYMAPEQRFGGPCDARADLYAIGVLLHEMLAGTRAFADDSLALDGFPPTLVALVARLLAFDPEARPPSARAVADALHGELGVASTRAWIERRAARLKLAVLPFHGDGDGIVEELVDRLSTLQDATVLAASATARFGDVDPRTAGAQLGVDVVIEGTLRRTGDDVVVTARLVETAHGTVAWSERFVGTFSEVLHLNEQLARRIAEALRVELGALPFRGVAPDEAVAMYMRARGKLARIELAGPSGAVADLDRVVALAPDFAPAHALRALAYARAWFFALLEDRDDWRARALRALTDATARAPGFPETELATGVFAWQNGELAIAADHLARTLELAPSHPVALEYLGRLLCEGGRPDEGTRFIALACELDPQLWLGLLEVARHYALHRCWHEYETTMAEIERRGGRTTRVRVLELRIGVWRRSADAVARWADELEVELAMHRIYKLYAAVALGAEDIGELDALVSELLAPRVPRRFASFAHQLAAEAAGARGQPERAFHHLEAASDAGLIDLEWLDLCPVLGVTRTMVGFTELRRTVRMRAAALWRSDSTRAPTSGS
jgi:serine/threonine-protein kinase